MYLVLEANRYTKGMSWTSSNTVLLIEHVPNAESGRIGSNSTKDVEIETICLLRCQTRLPALDIYISPSL